MTKTFIWSKRKRGPSLSADKKLKILKAAEQSFALFGYKATTMDQVARIANVGKGTIYTFFKNKEDLFHEIIDQFIADIKAIAEKAIQDEASFDRNLHQALYSVLEYRKKHQLTIKLSQEVREFGTMPAHEALSRLENAIISFIEKHIQKAIDKGEIAPCQPKVTAYAMFKLYIAFVFEWEQSHPPLEKNEIAQLFELYFIKGLEKRR